MNVVAHGKTLKLIVEWNINNILVNSQRKNLRSGFVWQWMLGVKFLEY